MIAAKNKIATTGLKFQIPMQSEDHIWPGGRYSRFREGLLKQAVCEDKKW